MKKLVYFCLCASLSFTCPMYSIEAATYEYDELGRVTQVTNEDGSLVTYIYDANGNIVEIKTETANEKTSGPDDVSEEATGVGGGSEQSVADSDLQNDAKDTAGNHTSVISDYTVSDNQSDDLTEDNQEKDDNALDLVEEEIAKRKETEVEDKKNQLLLALIAAGATGGVAILLWKKMKKSKEENEEESDNE